MIKVLIVDPNPYFIRCLRAMLAGRPDLVVVGEACNAAEARAKAQIVHPDLALVDVRTPGLGNELDARHAKRWPPARKIIALTVFDAAFYRAALAADGADECLAKETLEEELLPAITRLFPQEVTHDQT